MSMEFRFEMKPKSRVVLTAVVSEDELQKHEKATIKKLMASTKIAGFRPGKATEARIREHYTDAGIKARVIDDALPTIYATGVKEKALQPIGRPEAEIKEVKPLTVEFTVDVYPTIELKKLDKIRVQKKPVAIEDPEIDDVLSQLQKRLRTFAPVERVAAMGDSVEVSFTGDLEGVPDPRLKSQHHPLLLGSNAFIPGFEEGLVGKKAGDIVDLTLPFPSDYRAADLRGKKATFHVTIEVVEEVTLPALDDELAKKVTGKPEMTMVALRDEIRADLLKEKERAEAGRLDEEFATALVERTTVELPETLVHEEVHYIMDELAHRVEGQGLKFEHYLELRKTTQEGMEASLRPEAEKRLTVRLALRRAAQDLNIVVPDEEVEAALSTLENPAVRNDERVRSQLAAQILLEKTLTTLREAATRT